MTPSSEKVTINLTCILCKKEFKHIQIPPSPHNKVLFNLYKLAPPVPPSKCYPCKWKELEQQRRFEELSKIKIDIQSLDEHFRHQVNFETKESSQNKKSKKRNSIFSDELLEFLSLIGLIILFLVALTIITHILSVFFGVYNWVLFG